jgi:cell volume regulation protein A
VLVLGFIDAIQKPDYTALDLLWTEVTELTIGAVVGLAVGYLAAQAFQRANFPTTGLYPVASVAAAGLSFGIADVGHGSGFLAVYLTGLVLGSVRLPARRTVGDFHDAMAWVSQIAVFFTLGLLVFPSEFGGIFWEALLVAGVLMFVARPLATYVCTLPFRFTFRESTLLGWAGLRGAVPIVLATFPVIEGIPNADPFFNIVFFVVLTSTLIQGVTFEPLAKALKLTTEEPALPRPLVEVGTIRRLGAEVLEFPVRIDDAVVGKLVNQLMLPREALVNVIVRGDEALLPRGSTTIEAGDRLHILVRQPVHKEVENLFERWREGPIGEEEEIVVPMTGRQAIFSVRPWRDHMGDPGRPVSIDGVAVVRTVRLRRGNAGALVVLEDGRFAVTGDGLIAAGGPRQLFRYCRERIRRADDPASEAWWQEVAGVISQRAVK